MDAVGAGGCGDGGDGGDEVGQEGGCRQLWGKTQSSCVLATQVTLPRLARERHRCGGGLQVLEVMSFEAVLAVGG